MIQRFAAAALLIIVLFGGPAVMAQDDSLDFGLWQMVQHSNTPADYQIYLQAFPNGKFAALARIRANAGGSGTVAQAAPEARTDPDAPQFSVTPLAGRIGQRFTVDCGTLPAGGQFDTIVAVPAGSPPTQALGLTQHIQMDYVANCRSTNGDATLLFGPLPPGRWEFRWMTTLYNLENRSEMKAKVDVVVR